MKRILYQSKKLRSRLRMIAMLLTLSCIMQGCSKRIVNTKEQTTGGENSSYSFSGNSDTVVEYGGITESKSTMLEDRVDGYIDEGGTGQGMAGESYLGYKENSFLFSKEQSLSTFSIDVDTASYSNMRRMVQRYSYVEPSSVRIEEWLNYFDYNYEKPEGRVPFRVHVEASNTPWNNKSALVLIGIQGQEMKEDIRPKNNLVFLIDVSGSMDDNEKLPLVKKSIELLTERLTEDDRVSLVTYSGKEEVVLVGARGNEREKILTAVNGLVAKGSTAGEAGLQKAYEIGKEYYIEGGNNRILLATDGDLNVGISSTQELQAFIEEKRETGIYLSVLGYGTGNYNDGVLETLADYGNGNYSYIDSELEAKKVLQEELQGTLYTIAKDVKIQVDFNPDIIEGYRLIGYENRILASEDFTDDTKDAGEIGSNHSVTALYEVSFTEEYKDILSNYLESNSKDIINSSNITDTKWFDVHVRYKLPDETESKEVITSMDVSSYDSEGSSRIRFASAVTAFGMLCKGSNYVEDISYELIFDILQGMEPTVDIYKNEFVELVKTMYKNNTSNSIVK